MRQFTLWSITDLFNAEVSVSKVVLDTYKRGLLWSNEGQSASGMIQWLYW